MPLQFLIPALLRVVHASPTSPSGSRASMPNPLDTLLQPFLLTSRASSQKYHSRIPHVLAEENDPADAEEEYMWYAYQKDKSADVEGQEEQDEYETQERLKSVWLERMERREYVSHRYFVCGWAIGSCDLAPAAPRAVALEVKEAQASKPWDGKAPPAPVQPLEERLESYMDKLAMWQLMQSVDSSLGVSRAESSRSTANGLEKGKQEDSRDWMQVFCEDIVEPLFRDKLPELCALFHSKLFPDAANSDTDTLDLSPPVSPKPTDKLPRTTKASGPGSAASSKADIDAAQRARSRSLSISLEQEQRERSRSVSIGPGSLRKRAIVREVSMTTVFKGKERVKSKASLLRAASSAAPGPSFSRTQGPNQSAPQDQRTGVRAEEKSARGTVLVAATPTKSRTLLGPSQPPSQPRLPSLFPRTVTSQHKGNLAREESVDLGLIGDQNAFATPTKRRRRGTSRLAEDTEDEDAGTGWNLSSSPDVLLLGASGSQEWDMQGDDPPASSSSPADLRRFDGADRLSYGGRTRERVMVGDTPTKTR
ncbi:hypothetical protein BN946_scf185033.g53 [Trametes cinnabarina]|uniref:DNA replication regulator Sld3 C-terminal domain-containing protein n=1 Tax=Pycnoporus cinnabarinus TaxID=5643 RepID=A0A060SRT9_PYCCI|nr:hypothetical protein BN946_scf185033.g53 [Trametes cinnabarina]